MPGGGGLVDQVAQADGAEVIAAASLIFVTARRQLGQNAGQALGNGKRRVGGDDDAEGLAFDRFSEFLEGDRVAVGVPGLGFK